MTLYLFFSARLGATDEHSEQEMHDLAKMIKKIEIALKPVIPREARRAGIRPGKVR